MVIVLIDVVLVVVNSVGFFAVFIVVLVAADFLGLWLFCSFGCSWCVLVVFVCGYVVGFGLVALVVSGVSLVVGWWAGFLVCEATGVWRLGCYVVWVIR